MPTSHEVFLIALYMYPFYLKGCITIINHFGALASTAKAHMYFLHYSIADWVTTYVGRIPGASGFLNMFGKT